MHVSFTIGLLLLASAPLARTAAGGLISNSIHGFIDLNCFDCHNEVDKEGGLDLENSKFDPTDVASMNQWILMYDRVKKGEMPPPEKVELPDDERASFLYELGNHLHRASERRQHELGRVRSRRLNRLEYEKTVQDLLGVGIPLRKLIPDDATQDGFNNVADAQQISYHLLQKYLEAADTALDEAFCRALTPDEPMHRALSATDFAYPPEKRVGNNRGPWLWNDRGVVFSSTQTYHGRMHATKVPESGWYRIRLSARALDPPEGRGVWTSVRSGICYAIAPTMFWIGHVKIDPPGFALESYDVIGGWREHYRAVQDKGKWHQGPAVDPSFQMENGQTFRNIDEFKRILLNNPEKIAHNLVEKCIIFATGASIEFADRKDMDAIIHAISDENYGFRSMIRAVVQSPVFLNK